MTNSWSWREQNNRIRENTGIFLPLSSKKESSEIRSWASKLTVPFYLPHSLLFVAQRTITVSANHVIFFTAIKGARCDLVRFVYHGIILDTTELYFWPAFFIFLLRTLLWKMSLAMRIEFRYSPAWCFICAFRRELVVLNTAWS
jgi:hypothetical protein